MYAEQWAVSRIINQLSLLFVMQNERTIGFCRQKLRTDVWLEMNDEQLYDHKDKSALRAIMHFVSILSSGSSEAKTTTLAYKFTEVFFFSFYLLLLIDLSPLFFLYTQRAV